MNKFLFEDYLRHSEINYKSSGKNIGEGWLGIQNCPFCGDSRFHLGVNKKAGIFSCWVCKEGGTMIKLIKELEGISYKKAHQLYENFCIFDITPKTPLELIIGVAQNDRVDPNQTIKRQVTTFLLPPSILPLKIALKRYEQLFKYIVGRGFTEEDVENWGEAYYCFAGKFQYRIIFPIYLNGVLVNYVGRTIVKNPTRYLNCNNSEAILPIKDCLFNYDSWKYKEPVVICEGIFDVLKIRKFTNYSTVGLFGKQISIHQLFLLKEKQPTKVWLFLDRDAWSDSFKIMVEIQNLVGCKTEILVPDFKDPDSVKNEQEMRSIFCA